ncbi:MAG: hypothetical protein WBF90_12605 [Rivularia sp. (in: cyanobacteria)]
MQDSDITPEVLKKFTDELLQHPPVSLTFQALDFWAFVGLIQLASRNPVTDNVMGNRVFDCVKSLVSEMNLSDAAKAYLDKGWDSNYDTPTPTSSTDETVTVLKKDFICIKIAFEIALKTASITSGIELEDLRKQVRVSTEQYYKTLPKENKESAIEEYYEELKNKR